MRKLTCTVIASGLLLSLAGAPMKNIHGWNTWKRADGLGQCERIAPNAEFPHGTLRIIPVAGTGRYSLQVYGRDPAKPDDFKRYTIIFSSAADTNADATASLHLSAKNQSDSWYRVITPGISKSLTVLPGQTQQITVEVDLKRYKAPDIGSIQPTFTVNSLKSGSIVIHSLDAETQKSTYVPPTGPTVAGLPGFTAQPEAFHHFEWSTPVAVQKFEKMLDFTAIGLNIVTLTPANRAAAVQWRSGATIKVQYSDNNWQTFSGATPEKLTPVASLPGPTLTMAAYGTGVLLRRDAAPEVRMIPGGLEATGMTLLSATGAPVPKVRALDIINDALAWCYLDEAEKVLTRAQKRFNANFPIIQKSWGPNNGERRWKEKFTFFSSALADGKRQAQAACDGFLTALVQDPVLRDRYNWLVDFGGNQFAEEGGYFGGYFRKHWFTKLGGQPAVLMATEFARKVDALVSRARRTTGASFSAGVACQGPLSAGWVDALTAVPHPAGLPDNLAKTISVDMARGEAESLQLVLATGVKAAAAVTVAVTAPQAAPQVQLFKVHYLSLVEAATPQLPLHRGGDTEVADVLEPLAADTAFAVAPYRNQPIFLTLRAPENARPGTYDYQAEIAIDGKKCLTLPFKVTVRDFSLGRNRLDNMAGYRPNSIPSWYGTAGAEKARRNLSALLLEHNLNPLDLYNTTPQLEDLAWLIERGLSAANLGGTLNGMAHPEPGMVKFVQLYGSADGENFTLIPAQAALRRRDAKNPLSDEDLIVTPQQSTAPYRYLKVHYSETRGWYDRVPYSFVVLYPTLGDAVVTTDAEGRETAVKKLSFLQPDSAPTRGKTVFGKLPGSFKFDNLRDGANLGSVVLDKGAAELKSIRLVNRSIEIVHDSLKKRYTAIRKIAPPKFPIYLYGFDETLNHLNGRMLSALKNTKLAFPDVTIVSTVGNPAAQPEIFQYLDVHCPANIYALPRLNEKVHKKYGTKFWTYVGGGGYYPFSSFERVDQPLINSRAFFWEPIAFDHIVGFLYWDIHMWRNNMPLAGNYPIDWSLWNPTHGNNNGMGALFYPGPDNTAWPSLRAAAMRDGIDDCNAVLLAAELIAKLPAAAQAQARAELQTMKNGFATGMSVFQQDPEQMYRLRERLYDFISGLSRETSSK